MSPEVEGSRQDEGRIGRLVEGRIGGPTQGMPPDDHHYVYAVGFPSLGPPSHAEAVVFVWSTRPVMDEQALHDEAVRLMGLMIERARG